MIISEMLRCMDNRGRDMLTVVIKKAWTEGIIPTEWQKGVILPLHKHGDKKNCQNYIALRGGKGI